MQTFIITDSLLAWHLLRGILGPEHAPLVLAGTARLRARLARQGATVISGDLTRERIYRRAGVEPGSLILLFLHRRSAKPILSALYRVAPDTPVLLIRGEDNPLPPVDSPSVTVVTVANLVQPLLRREMERACLRLRVERIRGLFEDADRMLIMLQDDPDPDAIASALALRTLLGRNKATAPIASFGAITRPENLAMVRALEIEVEQIKPGEVQTFKQVAMVDVQPPVFEEEVFSEVALVIDHHPEAKGYRARMKEIRPSYGATATIMTEYLRAAEVKITQRLATALLYGISSDTGHLGRGATQADLEAFAHLYPLGNHALLRRIEHPELPVDALDALSEGLGERQIVNGVIFAHLGRVSRLDLIPQFADLCLHVEGVEWSVVSGIINEEFHLSVRNVGYIKSAGDVVKEAFGELGSAGGHRAMAKAVIPMSTVETAVGSSGDQARRRWVVKRFMEALSR